MINRTVLVLVVIAVVSGAAGFLSGRHVQEQRVAPVREASRVGIGHPLPAIEGEAIDRSVSRLADFRGRAVLVNFWATWCAPCRREMPDLMALRDGLDKERAEVVGVALDLPQDVRNYVDELGIDYPIVIADEITGTRVLRELGNQNGLLPFSVLVDTEGVVREVHLGELSQDEARDLLAPLM